MLHLNEPQQRQFGLSVLAMVLDTITTAQLSNIVRPGKMSSTIGSALILLRHGILAAGAVCPGRQQLAVECLPELLL